MSAKNGLGKLCNVGSSRKSISFGLITVFQS